MGKGKGRGEKMKSNPKSSHLDKLIEEATVDCYDDSEATSGIFNMMEENLEVPFKTTILGVEATVDRIDMNEAGEIVAVCRRGRDRQKIHILDLPLPKPRPKGAEWIDAYRRWARGR